MHVSKSFVFVQFYLTTILLIDRHGNGLPVAFYVHSRNTSRIIRDCLTSLLNAARKEDPDFSFSSVGCDDAMEEISAIRSAHMSPTSDFLALPLHCVFEQMSLTYVEEALLMQGDNARGGNPAVRVACQASVAEEPHPDGG